MLFEGMQDLGLDWSVVVTLDRLEIKVVNNIISKDLLFMS